MMKIFLRQYQFKNQFRLLKNPLFVLLIILLAAIGFRLYKAHYTGIIYDEVWTYEDYCQDLHIAVTSYQSTNNHLLNSIFIVLTQKVLGGYDHFIRVPAVLFGALFCCAITYIVHKTIRSSLLKVIILPLVLMNWFIFDLTYLARGYALALGATFTGIAVLMHLSSKAETGVPVSWRVIFFLIAMNFTALGSMLSSLSLVLNINIAYGLLMILGSSKRGEKTLIKAMGRLGVIALGSAAALYLLYQHVFSNMISLRHMFEVEPFYIYLKRVLWRPLLYTDLSQIKFNLWVYNASLGLLAFCTVICLWASFTRLKSRKGCNPIFSNPALLILLLSLAVLLFMFVQSMVFGFSLGLARNGVFLLSLILISTGILMDRAAWALSRVKFFPLLLRLACTGVLTVMCFRNLPSRRAVDIRTYDWGVQSAIGPLTRILHQIDPYETWEIKLREPQTINCNRSIRYYSGFGYNIKQVKGDAYDLWVYPEHPPDRRVVYFAQKRFADHHCCIVVNVAAFQNKRSLLYDLLIFGEK